MADPLATGLNQFGAANAAGNLAAFQELIREFNLNYANNVAQLYGQNFGPGNPAPIGASTLAAGQAVGSIGYIPGFSALDTGQTQSNIAQQASTAQNAASLTGFYTQPKQSAYTPGTFLRIDPGTYDTQRYGDLQMDVVLPSGQLQRINTDQARAMGWNGDVGQMAGNRMIPFSTAATLEAAPPTQLPQQTLQGLTTYSNLNTAAQNQAIAQAGVTGMYQAPATVNPVGTNAGGGKFSDLDNGTQMAYYYSNGGDWQAAMNKWVADSNNAIRQAVEAAGGKWTAPGQPGAPQETLAAQGQYFTQAGQLAQQFGQYYQPGMPGQPGQAGVNAPPVGAPTMAREQQTYAQNMGMIAQAAALQANPFRQQQAIGQMGRLLQNQTVAGFAAPQTVAGVGTQGGNTQGGMGYLQQMIDDIQGGGAANSQGVKSVLDAIPTPTKLDSVQFYKAPQSTQNLVLQGMQEKYGLDPQDSLAQIKNTLPGFQAPQTFGTIKRPSF